jgi:hypothetical protein
MHIIFHIILQGTVEVQRRKEPTILSITNYKITVLLFTLVSLWF